MPLSPSRLLVLFCLTSATLAATLANPLMESLSNAGAFGAASYTDHSNVDVVPALLIGAAGALLWTLTQVARLLGRTRPSTWIARSARALETRPVASLLPFIFAAQLAALFSMETIEQVALYGHVLGPSTWLGGPVAISLLAHALACVGVTFALRYLLRTLATTIAAVVRYVVRSFAIPADAASIAVSLLLPDARVASSSLLRSSIGERAPPLSA